MGFFCAQYWARSLSRCNEVKSGSQGGGAKQHKRSEMTSFLFLELSKTHLLLINTSIDGVFLGAAASPF